MDEIEFGSIEAGLRSLFIDIDYKRKVPLEEGIQTLKSQIFKAYVQGFERGVETQKARENVSNPYKASLTH